MILSYILGVIGFWLICSYAARFLTTFFFLRNKAELQESHYDFDDYDGVILATIGGPISLVILCIMWPVVWIIDVARKLQIRDPQKIAIDFAIKRKKGKK